MFLGLGLPLTAFGTKGGVADAPDAEGGSVLPTLWADKVTLNGGTYSAGTLAALQTLADDLDTYELTAKLVYLNPRCGSDLIAARTPLINLASESIDGTSGTFAAWNEANGLLNSSAGVIDTNVPSNFASFGAYDASAGAYFLNDCPSGEFFLDNSFPAGLVLSPAQFGDYIIFDCFNAGQLRVLTAFENFSDLTKGLICGSFYGGSSGFVARNGEIRGTTVSVNAGLENRSDTVKLYAAIGTSAGDFLGKGLTPDDATNLTFILHTFNTALGRQVVADGLP